MFSSGMKWGVYWTFCFARSRRHSRRAVHLSCRVGQFCLCFVYVHVTWLPFRGSQVQLCLPLGILVFQEGRLGTRLVSTRNALFLEVYIILRTEAQAFTVRIEAANYVDEHRFSRFRCGLFTRYQSSHKKCYWQLSLYEECISACTLYKVVSKREGLSIVYCMFAGLFPTLVMRRTSNMCWCICLCHHMYFMINKDTRISAGDVRSREAYTVMYSQSLSKRVGRQFAP